MFTEEISLSLKTEHEHSITFNMLQTSVILLKYLLYYHSQLNIIHLYDQRKNIFLPRHCCIVIITVLLYFTRHCCIVIITVLLYFIVLGYYYDILSKATENHIGINNMASILFRPNVT